METQVPTKEGNFQKVFFPLYLKTLAKIKGLRFPKIMEIPAVFGSQEEPDYGQIFETLKECPQKLEPAMSLYVVVITHSSCANQPSPITKPPCSATKIDILVDLMKHPTVLQHSQVTL